MLHACKSPYLLLCILVPLGSGVWLENSDSELDLRHTVTPKFVNVFPDCRKGSGTEWAFFKDGNFEFTVINKKMEAGFGLNLKGGAQSSELVENEQVSGNLKGQTKHSTWSGAKMPSDSHSMTLSNVVAPASENGKTIGKLKGGKTIAKQLFLYKQSSAEDVIANSGFHIQYEVQLYEGGKKVAPETTSVLARDPNNAYAVVTITQSPQDVTVEDKTAQKGQMADAPLQAQWKVSLKPGDSVEWDVSRISNNTCA